MTTSSSLSDQNLFSSSSTTTPLTTTTAPPSTTTPSLLSFLRLEVTRGYALELEEERFQARRDKVYMFLLVPREMERLMGYGFFQCMDAFLYLLTFLPLRVAHSLLRRLSSLISSSTSSTSSSYNYRWSGAEVCDALKLFVLMSVVYLFLFIDTSVLYHLVKSQSVIKLYIFFNMLEVGDRLFASFVQDTIDALFLTATENSSSSSKSHQQRNKMSVGSHLLLVIFAVFGHALVILLQGTTLSVAINASNRALLTVMMSNNFVELKGAVFKKFDKINLFQVSCSDVRERFHLVVLLLVVCLQTMREYSWEESRFWVLFPDCLMVLLAEVGVDWVKHCFITRFNELDADVYREYTLSLAYDLAQTKQRGRAFSDHSDMVGRRLGFVPLPLAVVLIRILRPCFPTPVLAPATIILTTLAFLALASFRTVSSILLLGKACDLIDHHHNATTSSQPLLQQQVQQHHVISNTGAAAAAAAPSSPSHGSKTVVKDEFTLSLQQQQQQLPENSSHSVNKQPITTAVTAEEDTLSDLLLRRRRKDQIPSSPPKKPKRYSRSMSACSPQAGEANYATYSGGAGGAGSSLSARDLMKEEQFHSTGGDGHNDDGWGLESFGRLLPANSAVSILSVQFNEEMIKASCSNSTAAADAGKQEIPVMLQRKHSLGSCLVDSENVMLQQQVQQQHSDDDDDDDKSYHRGDDNVDNTTTVLVKTEEDAEENADEDEVYLPNRKSSSEVDDLTTTLRDLNLQQQLQQEEEEETAPPPPAATTTTTTETAETSSTTTTTSSLPSSPSAASSSSTLKRVKKKSLTVWLKELGGGGGGVTNSNSVDNK